RLIARRDWARSEHGIPIHRGNGGRDLRSNGRSSGGGLIFSPNVHDPAASRAPAGETFNAVEASPEPPPEIAYPPLAPKKTLRQRRAGDFRRARIDGFQMRGIVCATAEERQLLSEFSAKRII